MFIQISPERLIVQLESGSGYTYDKSGRLLNVRENGWFVVRGLDGRMAAHQWGSGGRHDVKILSEQEKTGVHRRTKEILRAAESAASNGLAFFSEGGLQKADISRWVNQALLYDFSRDEELFRRAYKPVGILPPDQYSAVVVQATEGCAWNRCSFCSFYRGEHFRVKTQAEFLAHLRAIREFFGDGLSFRNSIFLGEANAPAVPAEELIPLMEKAESALASSMKDFRGFYSFAEAGQASCRSREEFRRLAGAGLRGVYYGLETGNSELREFLRKPGTVEDVLSSVREAKAGGLSVGIILLLGAGGRDYFDRHAADSILAVHRAGLSGEDMVFLSPLEIEPESPYAQAAEKWGELPPHDVHRQSMAIRSALPPGVRSSIYDIRGFIYA
ncbi:MAG: radical SAM protein [Elusimicrobia bacterium]|nr:radical SAM protein [Elusimicrobiota bacterium]